MNTNKQPSAESIVKAFLAESVNLENTFGSVVRAALTLVESAYDEILGSDEKNDSAFLTRKKADMRSAVKCAKKIGCQGKFLPDSRTAFMTLKTAVNNAESMGVLNNLRLDLESGLSVAVIAEKYGKNKKQKTTDELKESAFDLIDKAILIAKSANIVSLVSQHFADEVKKIADSEKSAEKENEKKDKTA